MPLYSLVPSFRPLLAPVPRLRFRTDTHTHTHRQTDRQTHTQDNYRNPPAHALRGLIMSTVAEIYCTSIVSEMYTLCIYHISYSSLKSKLKVFLFEFCIVLFIVFLVFSCCILYLLLCFLFVLYFLLNYSLCVAIFLCMCVIIYLSVLI